MALYWILDLNGTTIGKADSVSDYWTKVMVRWCCQLMRRCTGVSAAIGVQNIEKYMHPST